MVIIIIIPLPRWSRSRTVMNIWTYEQIFVERFALSANLHGYIGCVWCTQFRCHLSEQPVVQNAAFAHISAECSFFSSVFENGSMFVFAQVHGSTKPNLHCCCIALGCIALSFFMTLKTDSKDLWSLRHWWTLVCLWSICYGDFWKFQKFILVIVLMLVIIFTIDSRAASSLWSL